MKEYIKQLEADNERLRERLQKLEEIYVPAASHSFSITLETKFYTWVLFFTVKPSKEIYMMNTHNPEEVTYQRFHKLQEDHKIKIKEDLVNQGYWELVKETVEMCWN